MTTKSIEHRFQRSLALLFAIFCLVGQCLAADGAAPAPAAITLRSPMPYAVFQRSAANRAIIHIAGRTPVPVATLEAKTELLAPYQPDLDGTPVPFTAIGRPSALDFTGELEVPAGGWY